MNIDLARALPLAFSAAVMLTGCQHLDFVHVYDHFEGLKTTVDHNESLDVLIVNGMGQAMEGSDENYSGYSSDLRRVLARRLGYAEAPSEELLFPIDQGGVRVGAVLRARYRRLGGASELVFYELSWAQAVKPLKTVLLELDGAPDYREKSPLEGQRAWLNSKAKAFLNTHLADPLIYSGELGAVLRRDVEQAICIMTRLNPVVGAACDFDAQEKAQVKVAVISTSLGSTIVFDALYELSKQTGPRQNAALNVVAATTRVFMLANQLPLLELAKVGPPQAADWLDHYPCLPEGRAGPKAAGTGIGIAGFLSLRETARTQRLTLPPLYIVAFSDPNDLLTYFITDRFKRHCAGATFANVAVTNANTLWLLIAADPVRGHTGYSSNEDVMRMVVEGGEP
jgi:hypothetical protein